MPKTRSKKGNKRESGEKNDDSNAPSKADEIGTQKKNRKPSKKQKIEAQESNNGNPSSDEIKTKFLVDMPGDFYHLWEFCKSINAKNPECALKESLGLVLGGPYDVLTGKLQDKDVDDCVCHDRYHYDPPEFQTIIKGDEESLHHMGYYRDDPKELPVFVASNSAAEGCTITPMAQTVFGALRIFIASTIKDSKTSNKKDLETLQKSLEDFSKDKGINMDERTSKMKDREKKVVAKTFHGAGIVVPVGRNEEGYRPIPETYATQRKILAKVANSKTDEEKTAHSVDLEELVTLVQFANDECDYGMGFELAINIFCHGSDKFQSLLKFLLPTAYRLLKRKEFAVIADKFLSKRAE